VPEQIKGVARKQAHHGEETLEPRYDHIGAAVLGAPRDGYFMMATKSHDPNSQTLSFVYDLIQETGDWRMPVVGDIYASCWRPTRDFPAPRSTRTVHHCRRHRFSSGDSCSLKGGANTRASYRAAGQRVSDGVYTPQLPSQGREAGEQPYAAKIVERTLTSTGLKNRIHDVCFDGTGYYRSYTDASRHDAWKGSP